MGIRKTKTIPYQFKQALAGLVLAGVVSVYPALAAYADTFDDQINAIKGQVQQYQDQASQLQAQENTLQNAISALEAQQNALQAQISEKEVELQQLQEKIQETNLRISNQKDALGLNLKSMYLESDISPLEIVASSKSIGDFIDKQEYRNKIRDSIQDSLNQIKTLKAELEKQKADVEHVLADQRAMNDQLAVQQAQKDKLLADTKGQEAAYQSLVTQKNSEIQSLKAQQAAANARYLGSVGAGPACGGGYPGRWCNIPQDTVGDDWGMYNRECVSYTAFRVAASGRYMPYWGGVGNANQWPGDAAAAGIPVDGSPKAGDVAIWVFASANGHAMYVEGVSGDGSIVISDYNFNGDGHYGGVRTISASTYRADGFKFIHF
jgi:peptidoglycan DL-endopeptidase CwlO